MRTHGYGDPTVAAGEGGPSEPPATEIGYSHRSPSSDITVQFWGVRGSLPCTEPQLARYGGNTSCVEVRCGERLLIFDAGTGLRPLGTRLAQSSRRTDADLFFSHFHIDHVCGLPFFSPMYDASTRIRFWAGNLLPSRRIVQAIAQMMSEPLFPLAPDSFRASIEYHDFYAGDVLKPHPGLTLRTAALNHPGGATGYRLEFGRGALAYITDTEHRAGVLDRNVLELARNVDLMIYDCNYTDQEYPDHIGWGHSTWQHGVLLARAAGAKLLALFHHDPEHDDEQLDRIGREAKKQHPHTVVAAEGMMLRF
jgi:phosphoribosyl 1,2-cyclic phosphodiesterase